MRDCGLDCRTHCMWQWDDTGQGSPGTSTLASVDKASKSRQKRPKSPPGSSMNRDLDDKMQLAIARQHIERGTDTKHVSQVTLGHPGQRNRPCFPTRGTRCCCGCLCRCRCHEGQSPEEKGEKSVFFSRTLSQPLLLSQLISLT